MIKAKNIFILSFIFLFLPAFVLYIGATSFIRLFNFVLPVTLLLAIFIKPKNIINNFIFLFDKSPMIYLLMFFAWTVFVSFLAVITGYYSITSFLIYCVIQLFFRIFLVYSFPIIAVPRFINIKFIIKMFFIAYTCIFILGIIEFISAITNMTFITDIIHIISNIQDADRMIISGESNLLRIRSVFSEPGELGQFIAINMPIIYTIIRTKCKIFNNSLLNRVIKTTIIPLMLINLLLTQSPIYILISAIVTIIFFLKDIRNFIIKYRYFCISMFVIIIVGILIIQSTIDIEKTPLIRIIKVVSIFNSFTIEKLILADYSLATRVTNYINQFILFLHHPIFGIGFGNNEHILIAQLNNSPVPLTQEIYVKMATTNRVLINTNVMYLLLHQTGLIGYVLYVIFMLKTSKLFKNAKKYFTGIERMFLDGLSKTIICILLISSIYNITIFHTYLWVFAGLAGSVLLIIRKKGIIDERETKI